MNPHKLSEIIEGHSDPEPFSGVVSLTRGDDVLYQQGFGDAIRSESIPNTPTTRFQMASGCKIFTAVAICRLVEQGKLAFDTRLSDCVGIPFPTYAPEITVHHLLTHSSGITSYFEEDVDSDYEALWHNLPTYRVRGPRDFLPLFRHKPMKFAPGDHFEYNDGGFILLGLIVESVAGVPFRSYAQEHVLAPAGMQDSGYFAMDQLPAHTAYAYIRNEDGTWRTNFFAVPIVGGGDGGAYTTAPDMARFWQALTEHRFLSADTTAMMLTPHIATSLASPHSHYGYGVWLDRPVGRVTKLLVEGQDPGVAMRSVVDLHRGLVLTLLGNTEHAVWSLYRAIEKGLEL